jgi:hypothetical protein
MKIAILRGLPAPSGSRPHLGLIWIRRPIDGAVGLDMGPFGVYRFTRYWWPLPVIEAERLPDPVPARQEETATLELPRIVISNGLLYYDRLLIGPVLDMKLRWQPVPWAPWAFQTPGHRQKKLTEFRMADVRCTPGGRIKVLPRRP